MTTDWIPELATIAFASPLCPAAEAARLREQMVAALGQAGLRCVEPARPLPAVDLGRHQDEAERMAAAQEARGAVRTALVLTGGTEARVMAWSDASEGPLVIVAHPSHNSFPAALEIIARCAELGRAARLVLMRAGRVDGEPIQRLARARRALLALRGKTLGTVGGPSEWLVASHIDERELTRRWGVTLRALPMEELLRALDEAEPSVVAEAAAQWRRGATAIVEPNDADLLDAARVLVGLRAIVQRHALDAVALRCFDLLAARTTTGCLAVSQLIDDGVMAGCEGDVPTTLTMMWLHELTGQLPFVVNPQDVDVEGRTLWLAHCTIARGLTSGYRLRSHFESSRGVGIEAGVDWTEATLGRLGGKRVDRASYVEGTVLAHAPSEQRCRTQLALRIPERSRWWLEELLVRPLGNHLVAVPGSHEALLDEFRELAHLGRPRDER